MLIRTLDEKDGLDAARDELIYTEARLQADPLTKDLAPEHSALVTRTDAVRAAQKDHHRQETIAQAGVDHVHDEVDDFIERFSVELSHELQGDKQSPRYKRYFTDSPSDLEHLGLESQVAKVTPWATMLAAEPEPVLKALAAVLSDLLALAKAALDTRMNVRAHRGNHHAQDILALVADLNAARGTLAGELTKRGVARKKGKKYPLRFFRQKHDSHKPAGSK